VAELKRHAAGLTWLPILLGYRGRRVPSRATNEAVRRLVKSPRLSNRHRDHFRVATADSLSHFDHLLVPNHHI
jgi:hypothetical protein